MIENVLVFRTDGPIRVSGDDDGAKIEIRICGDVVVDVDIPPGHVWEGVVVGEGKLSKAPSGIRLISE